MPYRLKATEPPFEVVDGPFAGRKYDRAGTYAEIPPGQEDRFEEPETIGLIEPIEPIEAPGEAGQEVTHE